MNRRSFMVRTGTMLGTSVVAGGMPFPLSAVDTSAARALSGLSDWDTVRAQFNLAPNKINMSCYWQTSHPKVVREAIEQHRRGLDECPSEYYEDNAPRLEAAVRSAAAEYLAAKPDEFATTESTSQGLGTIYNGLKLRPGQEILSTEQEHIVTKNALRFRAERMGTPVRTISLYDNSATVTEPRGARTFAHQCESRRGGSGAPLRGWRARLRRGGFHNPRTGLRRFYRGVPQMALRTARNGTSMGQRTRVEERDPNHSRQRPSMETPSRRSVVPCRLDDARRIPRVRTSLGADRSLPLSYGDRKSESRRENSAAQHAMQRRPSQDGSRQIANARV